MIINGLKVTKEDFEGLLRGLQTIKRLINTNDRVALNDMLESLISRLETNLVADEQRELKIHDRVRVVSVDDNELNEFLEEEGFIVAIDNDWDYPYEVEFDKNNLSRNWLWRKENLQLI